MWKVGPKPKESLTKSELVSSFMALELHLQFTNVFLTTYDSHDDSPLSNACRMALSISLDDPLPPILNSNTVTRSRFFKVSFTISQCLTRFFFPKFSSTWFRISASTEASNIVCVLSKRTLKRLIYTWPTFWFFSIPTCPPVLLLKIVIFKPVSYF